MFGKHETDVLVVGAGPVGLITAICLRERGVRADVYDQDRRHGVRSYALALHSRTLRLLDELGVAQTLIAKGTTVPQMAFYEGENRQAEVRFDTLGGPFPFLLVVPQNILEETLREKLEGLGSKVHWCHRVQDLDLREDGVRSDVQRLDYVALGYPYPVIESVITGSQNVRASFVVGADGYDSRVRNLLGIDYVDYGDAGTFFVTEFETEETIDPEVRVVFEGERTSVCWPLHSHRARWSFQVDPTTERRPSQDDFVRFLETRAPWFTARPSNLAWSTIVKFEHRLATSFGSGRAWLAGDSAHLTGPVGVHSLNLGLQEGHDLATRIANVLVAGAPTNSLESLNDEWHGAWMNRLHERAGSKPETTAKAADAPVAKAEQPKEPAAQAETWIGVRRERVLSCLPSVDEDAESLLAGLKDVSQERVK